MWWHLQIAGYVTLLDQLWMKYIDQVYNETKDQMNTVYRNARKTRIASPQKRMDFFKALRNSACHHNYGYFGSKDEGKRGARGLLDTYLDKKKQKKLVKGEIQGWTIWNIDDYKKKLIFCDVITDDIERILQQCYDICSKLYQVLD
jgi:hypothetical protein